MRITTQVASKPSFGMPVKKLIKKPVAEEVQAPTKRTLRHADKLASLKKKAAKLEELPEDDDYEDDEEDDEEINPPKRSQALALAPSLGIQDFEVVRPIKPEKDYPEVVDGDEVYENVRKNNRQIAEPAQLPGVKPGRVRALKTMFGQRADTILSLLEDDQSTDGALTLIHRSLLQTMVDVLPVIERAVRKSHGRRGVIPMNQTVSQIRELVSDIKALRDRGHLGATIIERILRPSFLDIGVQLALGFNQIELTAKSRMLPEEYTGFLETLTETKRSLAIYIQQQYADVKEGVAASLT